MNKPLKGLNPPVNVSSNFTINAIQEDGTFDTKGYEVKLDENSTLKSVLDDINKNSGVSAFYDSFTGKIAFTAKYSGAVKDGHEIAFSGDVNFMNFLKVEENNSEAASKTDNDGNPIGTVGKNAKFTFNGLKTERNSNTVPNERFRSDIESSK